MEHNFICASANIHELDPRAVGMPIARERVDNVTLNTVLSNSFGFGGTNAAWCFSSLTAEYEFLTQRRKDAERNQKELAMFHLMGKTTAISGRRKQAKRHFRLTVAWRGLACLYPTSDMLI